jgi:hypothetical protein
MYGAEIGAVESHLETLASVATVLMGKVRDPDKTIGGEGRTEWQWDGTKCKNADSQTGKFNPSQRVEKVLSSIVDAMKNAEFAWTVQGRNGFESHGFATEPTVEIIESVRVVRVIVHG